MEYSERQGDKGEFVRERDWGKDLTPKVPLTSQAWDSSPPRRQQVARQNWGIPPQAPLSGKNIHPQGLENYFPI